MIWYTVTPPTGRTHTFCYSIDTFVSLYLYKIEVFGLFLADELVKPAEHFVMPLQAREFVYQNHPISDGRDNTPISVV